MEFPRVSPESVGVPSQAVLDLLDELYRYGIEMHSFMLLRHGKVFAQGHWKPYNPQTPHAMFSFTKSLTSTAIGFAVQEGLLSLDAQTLCDPVTQPRAAGNTAGDVFGYRAASCYERKL